jgi:hypothetical protein
MPQIVPDSGGTGNPAIDPNVRAKAMKTGYWSYRYDAKFNRVFQIPEDTSGEAASTLCKQRFDGLAAVDLVRSTAGVG